MAVRAPIRHRFMVSTRVHVLEMFSPHEPGSACIHAGETDHMQDAGRDAGVPRISSAGLQIEDLRLLLIAFLLLGFAWLGSAASMSFTRDIAPMLQRKCVVCHGPEKTKGGYRLDSYDALMKPGESRQPSIRPGKPSESHVVQLLKAADPDDRMPQKDDPLPPESIKRIETWITEGAVFDGTNPKAPLSTLGVASQQPAPKNYPRPIAVTALAFSLDGARLFASGYREVTVWNTTNGALVDRWGKLPQRIAALAMSPDGSRLCVVGGEPGLSGEIALQGTGQNASPQVLARTSDTVLAASFSADGQWLAAGGADSSIRLFDLRTNGEPRIIQAHADWVLSLAFSPDGHHLASASRDRSARVFRVEDGELASSFLGHGKPVEWISFSADGKQVLSAGRDKKVRYFDTLDPAKAGEVVNVGKEIRCMTRNGTFVFIATDDGVITQRRLVERDEVRRFTGHRDRVLSLALDESGKFVASGDFQGEVRVWRVDDGTEQMRFTATPGAGDGREPRR